MSRWRRSIIAQRCPKVWTPADERAFRASLDLLKADIRAAGGFERWLDTRMDDWLRGRPCPATIRHHAEV